MRLHRVFFALPVPEERKPFLRTVRDELVRRSGDTEFRGIRDDNLHLTLRFLGDTESGRLEELGTLLRRVAARHGRIRSVTRGIGAFPSISRARVVWMGVEGADNEFGALYEDLSAELDLLGFARDRKQFHPHVTIAYVRSRAEPRVVTGRIRQAGTGTTVTDRPESCVWDRIALVESTLTPKGAVHHVLEELPLR